MEKIGEINKLLDSQGRLGRKKYVIMTVLIFFMFPVYFSLIALVLQFISVFLLAIVAIILPVLVMLILLPVSVKRLHDIGKNGYYSLFIFIPQLLFYVATCLSLLDVLNEFYRIQMINVAFILLGLSIIFIFFLMFKKGEGHANMYGEAT